MNYGFHPEISDPMLKGIINGSLAFTGPETVQLDITNRCNNNCLCCWNNSPLLGKDSQGRSQEREYELSFEVLRRVLDELKEIGTKTLFLAGGGEPFIHPQIMQILKIAKECKMKVFINSNFTLVNKDMAKELVDMKIDHIHVSLLAGSPKTYAIIHPNKTKQTFFKIKEVLKYIAYLKQENNQHVDNPLPHINLYYVIFNKNFKEIGKMVDIATQLKADTVEFTPIDVIPGGTDVLLLNAEQIKSVAKQVLRQTKRLDRYNRYEIVPTLIEQRDNFLKRINSPRATQGEYEFETVTKQPCYVGWSFVRIKANGDVSPCLKAETVSVGNIYEKSFKDIWNGSRQQLFRQKSFNLDTSDSYLRKTGNDPDAASGCLRSCDNVQINIDMHHRYRDYLTKSGILKRI